MLPAVNSVCPVLINFQVAARRYDLDSKAIKSAEKQREKRAQDKLDGIARARPRPVRVVAVATEPDELPARRAWSQGPARKVKKTAAATPAAAPVKAFVDGVWCRLVGASAPAEGPKSTDELPLDNLELTPPPFDAYKSLIKARVKCKETASLLRARAARSGDIGKPLFKAATKISNCSLWGLFQSVNPSVNYKIGTALCKSRLCPNCQRVLAAKRKANFVDWFTLNAKQLRPYFFYHMVLTVRHSAAEGVRTNLYAKDMLLYFAELRGTSAALSGAQQRARSAGWKDFVAGGTYSVEVKQGRDTSPHIHIHCLLVAKRQLHNRAQQSVFLDHVRPLWKEITGDSDNVFIEPVYYLNNKLEKVHCHKGSEVHIETAVSECMKYTIKADASSLGDYSDSFLVDLLTMKNRYYSRFGCLSANDKSSAQFAKLDMLCIDYKDLEQLTRQEVARLFNPETGEIIEKEDTSILVTPFKNMEPQAPIQLPNQATPEPGALRLGGEPYFRLKPSPLGENIWFPPDQRDRAAILLSRSISADYGQPYDLPEVLAAEAQKST